MLSYQHHYHVGNHGDVLKHWVVYESVKYMQNKTKPFDYIDTHAGAGLYHLSEEKSQKLKEYEAGITQLLQASPSELSDFCKLMSTYVSQQEYPGSSFLANQLLRPDDRAWLFELHPQTYEELLLHCPKTRRCFPRREDGFVGLLGLLPNQSKRALVLIDPSYELKEDYEKVISIAEKAIHKMPNTVLAIWYPVVDRSNVEKLQQSIRISKLRNVLQLELRVTGDNQRRGMTGSGMIIINPPWTLKDNAEAVLPVLSSLLAESDSAGYDVTTLVNE